MHRFRIVLAVAALTLALTATMSAQIPRMISIQGLISDSDGQPSSSGQHQVQVSIYDAETGGNVLYSELQVVPAADGLVNIFLGEDAGLPATLEFDRPYWIGIRVDGGVEMQPRIAFTSAPYALNSGKAELADSAMNASWSWESSHSQTADVAGSIEGGVVESLNGASGDLTLRGTGSTTITRVGDVITVHGDLPPVPGVQRIDNYDGSLLIDPPTGPAVTMHIREAGVQTHHLRNLSVMTEKLGERTVTTPKLAEFSVTTPKLADLSVTTPKLDDGSVTTPKLDYKAVTRDKVADHAISTRQLSSDGATQWGQVLMYDDEDRDVVWSNQFYGWFSGDGQNIRQLDASHIDRGTLNDDRLSNNIPRLDASNHFTGPVNRFHLLQSRGMEIAGDHDGLGLRIDRGRSVLSYGNVPDGDTIPMDVSIVMIESNDRWGMSEVRLPAGAENGQVVVAVCDDPHWCRVTGVLIDDNEALVGRFEESAEFIWEPSKIIMHGDGVLFVKSAAGWIPVD